MPILRLDGKGDVEELGREGDAARKPIMVEADDVLKMSVVEDPQTLKDRQAVKNLQIIDHMRKVKSYTNNVLQNLIKKKQAQAAAEKMKLQEKKLQSFLNTSKNKRVIQALSQQGQMYESLSGVSGYGLTSDGRRPYLDRPAVDWSPELYAPVAFGSKDEDWGMGLESTTVSAPVITGPTGQLETMPGVVVSQPAAKSLVNVTTIDPGTFTEEDAKLIKEFEKDSYYIFYHKNGTWAGSFSVPFTAKDKANVNTNNSLYNSSVYFVDNKKKGWQYSGFYDDNGNWLSVIVPFTSGLPMDWPNNPDKSKRDQYRNLFRLRGYDFEYFTGLKPIILAYARKYKLDQANKKAVADRLEKEILAEASRAADEDAFKASQVVEAAATQKALQTLEMGVDKLRREDAIGKEIISQPKKSFAHPMLQYGLVSKSDKIKTNITSTQSKAKVV